MVYVRDPNPTPDGDQDPEEIIPTRDTPRKKIDESAIPREERRQGIPETPVPDLVEYLGRAVKDYFS